MLLLLDGVNVNPSRCWLLHQESWGDGWVGSTRHPSCCCFVDFVAAAVAAENEDEEDYGIDDSSLPQQQQQHDDDDEYSREVVSQEDPAMTCSAAIRIRPGGRQHAMVTSTAPPRRTQRVVTPTVSFESRYDTRDWTVSPVCLVEVPLNSQAPLPRDGPWRIATTATIVYISRPFLAAISCKAIQVLLNVMIIMMMIIIMIRRLHHRHRLSCFPCSCRTLACRFGVALLPKRASL